MWAELSGPEAVGLSGGRPVAETAVAELPSRKLPSRETAVAGTAPAAPVFASADRRSRSVRHRTADRSGAGGSEVVTLGGAGFVRVLASNPTVRSRRRPSATPRAHIPVDRNGGVPTAF